MLLSGETAEAVFRKVKQVQEEIRQYHLAPDRPDLPIEAFQRVIERMYKIRIEKYLVPFEGTFLRGMMERYDDRAIIYVRKQMQDVEIRFTAVKELCHIVIDEPDDWLPRGSETIKELIFEYVFKNDEEAQRVAQSEVFAEIAAIELLYPYNHRTRDIERLKNGETTVTKLANHFKVPDLVIGRATNSAWHEFATELWNRIG